MFSGARPPSPVPFAMPASLRAACRSEWVFIFDRPPGGAPAWADAEGEEVAMDPLEEPAPATPTTPPTAASATRSSAAAPLTPAAQQPPSAAASTAELLFATGTRRLVDWVPATGGLYEAVPLDSSESSAFVGRAFLDSTSADAVFNTFRDHAGWQQTGPRRTMFFDRLGHSHAYGRYDIQPGLIFL